MTKSKWEVGSWSPGNHCVIEWTKLPEPPFYAAQYRKVAEVYEQADVPKLAAAQEMYEALKKIASMNPGESYDEECGINEDCGRCLDMIGLAEEALKKARGEE